MLTVCTPLAERLEKSLLPADSRLWALYFENNIGPARCTSSISSSFSMGRDIQNCRPFELLVHKCEDPAMLFLTTRPQGHLLFHDGGWANWAS